MITWMMCHVSKQRTKCIERKFQNLTFIHFQGIRGGFVRLSEQSENQIRPDTLPKNKFICPINVGA